jgi:hypothetical protein
MYLLVHLLLLLVWGEVHSQLALGLQLACQKLDKGGTLACSKHPGIIIITLITMEDMPHTQHVCCTCHSC